MKLNRQDDATPLSDWQDGKVSTLPSPKPKNMTFAGPLVEWQPPHERMAGPSRLPSDMQRYLCGEQWPGGSFKKEIK